MTATGTVCGSCGAELRAGDKFCHGCGSPVTEADTHAEYKQVTVLFADVVRSMDIAAALDMERFREIVTELVERSAAVVRRYGGSVEFTGDGVMAVFGAPVALEDHAIRACLAAVGVQEEAKRLAVEVRERDGVDLQVRVGLNSGQAIAGEIGSGALGYAAIGEQVGMAQRMESVAPPGRGDAVGVHRATRRAHRDAGRTGVGAHQGCRRPGARAPAVAIPPHSRHHRGRRWPAPAGRRQRPSPRRPTRGASARPTGPSRGPTPPGGEPAPVHRHP